MIKTLIKAAREGGKKTLKYFDQQIETIGKGSASNFCTIADLESEKKILEIIKNSKLGSYNIVSEEYGKIDNKSEYTIIIDPLDGTNNFKLGVPNFSISIGLVKGSEIIAAVIYIPFLDDLYYAEKNKGAFKNNNRIIVNSESDILNSTISYAQGYFNDEQQKNIINSLFDTRCKRVLTQRSPAYDYCLLASGKIEGIINNKNEIYDFIAGKLLVTEAGGKIIYQNGENNVFDPIFIATNNTKNITNIIQKIAQKYII